MAMKTKAGATKPAPSGESGVLAEYLLSRAAQEDLAAYRKADLDRAVAIAGEVVAAHQPGASLVDVRPDPGIEAAGRPVSVITVVNDNMPFLFDSVLGEVTESAGDPSLVTHPVVAVRHGKKGVAEILGEAKAKDKALDRLSVIQVHVPRLAAERADELKVKLERVLGQVRACVVDWKPMLARLDRSISEFRYAPVPLDRDAVTEAIAFLEWLRDDNFVFLGMREFRYRGGAETGTLERTDEPGLGILSDPDVLVLRRGNEAVTTTPEIRAFLHGPEPLIVTKANAKSIVHRRIYLDYVGIKTYDKKGKLTGELRIVGLFTSTAYTRSVMKIPYLRSKAEMVIERSGFSPSDHSGKALINVLESYPRDELFQISVPVLRKHAEAILALGERPRVRALYRIDQFDRFVSILVFVPRDRYDSVVREKIGAYLKTAFEGRLSAFYPAFPEGSLARVHFIIGRSGGKTPKVEQSEIEAAIRDIVRTWEDALAEAAATGNIEAKLTGIASRFPESYRGSFTAAEALADAAQIARLDPDNAIAIDYYRHRGQAPSQAALKIYHFGSPVALSRRVPVLENMGFRVISERTFEVADSLGDDVFIHDMELENAFGTPIDLSQSGKLFEDVFLSVWHGTADNDGYNALALTASLASREIAVLRAYGRYLQQAGIPQSQGFIAATLNRYPDIARALFTLFSTRFDPAGQKDAEVTAKHLKAKIRDALEEVPNIDDDTIIRRYLNLIEASLRTNYFQPDTYEPGRSLAIKLDSRKVDGLPEPRPWREIFVFSAEVEGVHLRFGPVARGGLRWSDRAQDYRTEVLGLVKAQQVKNAIIVPVGAKGAFVPKQMPVGADRETVLREGTVCYKIFVSTLLDVTDNLEVDSVVPPPDVIRRDGDDPYLVVAADKGTASFSDTANAIAVDRDFWLGDAFASGGSAGYDHKKMGITARGGWEAVKRHFRELDRDIQTTPFTVVGVGDMSGDVFGNAMLLSPETRLIAAFDHRDIFIDPDPDAAVSLTERRRLFELPRSSWQDYNPELLSKGGGVYSRSLKTVPLFAEARKALGLNSDAVTPNDVIRAILKAQVDLLWFGGIGTYVRASGETEAQAGDKANDAVRIAGGEIRALVVGEGANLGMTQLGRVEYALKGGRINTDAIDNSAGVNSSDLEVNIKIALGALTATGQLTTQVRNEFLASMTDEVAALCLKNNYLQTLALSVEEARGLAAFPEHVALIEALEASGELHRAVEFLPDNTALRHRAQGGKGLTRPELAVLLAYAKNVANADLLKSGVPDDPYLGRELYRYFPDRLIETFEDTVTNHRLRREVIATVLSNAMINRGGPGFVNEMMAASSADAGQVAAGYAAARDVYGTPELNRDIDGLDGTVPGKTQLLLYAEVQALLKRETLWFLRNGRFDNGLRPLVDRYQDGIGQVRAMIGGLVGGYFETTIGERLARLETAGVSRDMARRFAELPVLSLGTDIVLVAERTRTPVADTAIAFFGVLDTFKLGRVIEQGNAIVLGDKFDRMALDRALANLLRAQRDLTADALATNSGAVDTRLKAWREAQPEAIGRVADAVQGLTEGEMTVSRLSVAAGLLGDLARSS